MGSEDPANIRHPGLTRHPSESWDIYGAGVTAANRDTPAFAGVTVNVLRAHQCSTAGARSAKRGISTSKIAPFSRTMRYVPCIAPDGVASGQPET